MSQAIQPPLPQELQDYVDQHLATQEAPLRSWCESSGCAAIATHIISGDAVRSPKLLCATHLSQILIRGRVVYALPAPSDSER